jgi:hypothetical protein
MKMVSILPLFAIFSTIASILEIKEISSIFTTTKISFERPDLYQKIYSKKLNHEPFAALGIILENVTTIAKTEEVPQFLQLRQLSQ